MGWRGELVQINEFVMVFMTNRRTPTSQGMCSCVELQLAADFSPSIVRLQKRESLFGLALMLDAFGGVVAADSLAGDAGGLPFVVVPDLVVFKECRVVSELALKQVDACLPLRRSACEMLGHQRAGHARCPGTRERISAFRHNFCSCQNYCSRTVMQ